MVTSLQRGLPSALLRNGQLLQQRSRLQWEGQCVYVTLRHSLIHLCVALFYLIKVTSGGESVC